jgi:hypothetical protein
VTASLLSNDTNDKVLACCNYIIGKRGEKDAEYARAPLYYDACWAHGIKTFHQSIGR